MLALIIYSLELVMQIDESKNTHIARQLVRYPSRNPRLMLRVSIKKTISLCENQISA
jgi:hypothetical protein